VSPAAAELANPLAPGTYAGDDPSGPVVTVFSRDGFTDRREEDWDITTVLLTMASSITVTDGGDATAATWEAALAGADVLVLPEGGNWGAGGSGAISDPALEVIRTWTEAGGTIIGTGSYTHGAIVSELTGIDYSSRLRNNDAEGPWDLRIVDPELPTSVPNGDWTGGMVGFSTWTDAERAPVTPVYYNPTTDNLAVAAFSIGSGFYLYFAYDWYPIASAETYDGVPPATVRQIWDETLRFAAGGSLTPRAGLTVDLAVTVGDQVSGSEIAISASGLEGDAPWTLELFSDPILIDDGIVPGSGTVNATTTFPSGLPSGWHRLLFTSTFADGSPATWEKWLHIAADGTLLELSDEAPALAETGASETSTILAGAGVLLVLGGVVLLSARRRRAARSAA
jgi:LPXTG-motif cell wall-anchored protein